MHLAIRISNTEIEVLNYVPDAIGAGKMTRKRTAKRHPTQGKLFSEE